MCSRALGGHERTRGSETTGRRRDATTGAGDPPGLGTATEPHGGRGRHAVGIAQPHWRVADAIEPLEQELKVNVMTSLQAIAWEAMRTAAIEDRVEGYGKLLREH